jgi:hypothetical protein
MGYQYEVQIQNGKCYVVSTSERLTPRQIWVRTYMGQFNHVLHIMERITTDEGIQTTEVKKPYGSDQWLSEESE